MPTEAAATPAPTITLVVMYSPQARVVHEREFIVPLGATVRQALEASGLLAQCPEIDLSQTEAFSVCVWGRTAAPSQVLRDLDRIEICRPLTVDPKVARRERFQKQGSNRAGLFSKRRAGAKSGY